MPFCVPHATWTIDRMPSSRHRRQKSGGRHRCPVCRRAFAQRGRGRPRRYCTDACRQVAYRTRKTGARRRRLVRLVEADAREFLPTLPDQSVDLIVTDPPYHFDRGAHYFRQWFAELGDDEWGPVFRELHRVLRQDAHAYVFCDRRTHPIFDAAAAAAGFTVHPPLVWDKLSIGLGGGAWRSQHELIAFYSKGSRQGNHRNRGDVLHAPRIARGYPTEKPLAVILPLIEQASLPGEIVLDPFCGSGTVGNAARRLERRALLIDVDATTAVRRLRIATERASRA
jgi:site-specific DNA-methyltransferase (adenine-specific)